MRSFGPWWWGREIVTRMHAAVDALNTNTPQPRGALVFVSQSAEDWSAYDPLLGEINNGALRARRRQVQ